MNPNKKSRQLETVIGLTIQLQKYGVGKIPGPGDNTTSIILGYYDNLLINPIYKWLDYSPERHWESGRQQMQASQPYLLATHYPIKLLFPKTELMQKMSCFPYDSWRNYEELLNRKPCMMLVLVNLTDAYKQNNKNNLLENFLDLLIHREKTASLLEQVSCCVLPSIGYSDFCILMAGTAWKPAMELVEYLHGLTDAQAVPVLSTDYMMPVYHRKAEGFDLQCFSDIQLSIRVNLKPGTTAQMLAQRVPEGIQVFRTSGGSDCLLQAQTADQQKRLLDFLLGSQEGGNFVIDMASTLQFPMDVPPNMITPNISDIENYSISVDDFYTAIYKYEQQLIRNKRHSRQANSLRELAASVVNVCSQRHAERLRGIMHSLISDFTFCLELCTAGMKKGNWNFDEAEWHVSEFCRIVNSFLTDLSRSDCFFMEQEKYSHTSISSATSLLIAYNCWINDFTKRVQEVTQATNESHYAFLVTSGGRDQTVTFDAFHFLNPRIKKGQLYEKIPLVTLMSEMSLYDFSGTILRSVHECMHFCGTRLRKERIQYLTSFVAMMLSRSISSVLFSEENTYQYAKDVYTTLCPSAVTAEDVDPLLQEAKTQYNMCLKSLENAIFGKIMEYLNPSGEFKSEKDYLARNVREWMYDMLLEAFSVYSFLDEKDHHTIMSLNSLAILLYEKTQEVYLAFYHNCDLLFKKNGINTAVFAFEFNKQEVYYENGVDAEEYKQDQVLHKRIQMILSRLLINIPPNTLPLDENDPYYKYWKQIFPYVTLTERSVRSVLNVAIDIFTETFADVMACKILRVSLEDYLLMHIYEDWNLDSSLPIDASIFYRISAVLQLCFRNDLCSNGEALTKEACHNIEQAIERLVAHGMHAGRLNAEELCIRINKLLCEFNSCKTTGCWLIDYLNLCIANYDENRVWEKLQKFAIDFEKIRLLSIIPNQTSTHDELVGMFYALINRESEADGGYSQGTEVYKMAGSRGQ